MSPATDPALRLAELRCAFDSSFALPPPTPDEEVVDLLAVSVDAATGPARYAVALASTAGLVADRPVTTLPGAPPGLLGVAGLRGHLVPVYDLARLLGADPARTAAPRWLLLAAGTPPFAVAVDRVDGHLRVATREVAPGGRAPTDAVVRTAGGPCPLVDLTTLRGRIPARNTP